MRDRLVAEAGRQENHPLPQLRDAIVSRESDFAGDRVAKLSERLIYLVAEGALLRDQHSFDVLDQDRRRPKFLDDPQKLLIEKVPGIVGEALAVSAEPLATRAPGQQVDLGNTRFGQDVGAGEFVDICLQRLPRMVGGERPQGVRVVVDAEPDVKARPSEPQGEPTRTAEEVHPHRGRSSHARHIVVAQTRATHDLQPYPRGVTEQPRSALGPIDAPPPSSERVRRVMQGNRNRDTGPEKALRSELHRRGLRFRLHRRIAPARTWADIVFPRQRVAIFVDGCFWHRCPEHFRASTKNSAYWTAKISRNVARDRRNDELMAEGG